MSDFEQIKIGEAVEREERLIASKLFRARTSLGIDRDELAVMAGLGITELVEYESGVQPIPASTLAMISAMMGVSMGYFYGEDALDNLLPAPVAAAKSEKQQYLVN
jgi:transcriptional regulator with XRE-family HTH domain